jgi:cation:H+ antiporter
LSAGFGVALIAFAGFNLIFYREAGAPAIAGVGWYAPLIVLLYAFAVRAVFLFERKHVERLIDQEHTYPHLTLRQAVARYGGAAAFVVAMGIGLPFIGERIAEQMGWTQSFVGTLFVAAATSAPEIAVTLAALRLGAVDMAIGGLLGSNLFNIVILAIDDVFYTSGPLFADVSSAHAASAFSAVMMTGIAIIGLMLRPRSRVARTVSRVSLFLLAVFLLNVTFLYLYGK